MLSRLASLSRPENSTLQKSSVIIIIFFLSRYSPKGNCLQRQKCLRSGRKQRSFSSLSPCLRLLLASRATSDRVTSSSCRAVIRSRAQLVLTSWKIVQYVAGPYWAPSTAVAWETERRCTGPEEVTRTCNVVCNRCSETSSFKSVVKFKQRVPVRENTKGTVSEKMHYAQLNKGYVAFMFTGVVPGRGGGLDLPRVVFQSMTGSTANILLIICRYLVISNRPDMYGLRGGLSVRNRFHVLILTDLHLQLPPLRNAKICVA